MIKSCCAKWHHRLLPEYENYAFSSGAIYITVLPCWLSSHWSALVCIPTFLLPNRSNNSELKLQNISRDQNIRSWNESDSNTFTFHAQYRNACTPKCPEVWESWWPQQMRNRQAKQLWMNHTRLPIWNYQIAQNWVPRRAIRNKTNWLCTTGYNRSAEKCQKAPVTKALAII